MSKVAKVAAAKARPFRACSAGSRSSAWAKTGGARILTREEVMASLPPLKPGEESAHDWMRRMFRPLREYNLWLIRNGHPEGLGELDESLREGSDAP